MMDYDAIMSALFDNLAKGKLTYEGKILILRKNEPDSNGYREIMDWCYDSGTTASIWKSMYFNSPEKEKADEVCETFLAYLDKETVGDVLIELATRPRKQQLGERIKQARTKAGLTQMELASKSGLMQGQISRWENGQNVPTFANVSAIAKALGIKIDELAGGE